MNASHANVGLSLLIDIGKTMDKWSFLVPIHTFRNLPRREGLTVEKSLASLDKGITADMGVQIPEMLIDDCVRLCCSLCLLENAPLVIVIGTWTRPIDVVKSAGTSVGGSKWPPLPPSAHGVGVGRTGTDDAK